MPMFDVKEYLSGNPKDGSSDEPQVSSPEEASEIIEESKSEMAEMIQKMVSLEKAVRKLTETLTESLSRLESAGPAESPRTEEQPSKEGKASPNPGPTPEKENPGSSDNPGPADNPGNDEFAEAKDLIKKFNMKHLPTVGEEKEHFVSTELSKSGMPYDQWLKTVPYLLHLGDITKEHLVNLPGA